MSSSNGTNYFQKSMNGIITLDDGGGSVIENGVITADSINVDDFTTNTLTTYDLTVNHNLNVVNNIQSAYLFVDNNLQSYNMRLTDQFGVFNGQNIDSGIIGGYISLYDITANTTLKMGGNTTDITIGENTTGELNICPNSSLINFANGSSGNVNIGNTGIISLGNIIKILGASIYGGAINETVSLFPTQTTGICNIATAITSGSIQIGNPTIPSIIKLGNNLKISSLEIYGGAINSTIGLFPTQTGGEIQIASGLTTGVCLIGQSMTSGYVQVSKLKISGQTIQPVTPATTCNILTTSTGSIGFGGSGQLDICNNQLGNVINIGQNKTSGWVLLGSALSTIIIKGPLSCEKEIYLGNATSSNIYSTNASAPFQIRGDNTLNVIGAGQSKFGSWNGGDVELGTQSYSNVIIGAGGSGANAKTTTIKGTIVMSGNGGTNTTLFGGSTFGTSTGNFSIPSPINIYSYFFNATGSTVGQILTLPSYINGQQIYIRNQKLTASLVVQCFGTQSLSLRNGTTATNFTMSGVTNAILIGTATTWYLL